MGAELVTGAVASDTKEITIGGAQNGVGAGEPNELCPAMVDDVRVYRRALAADEIAVLAAP